MIVAALVILMWLVPFRTKNVSVSLTADASFDGQSVAVTITDRHAYRTEYRFEKTVSNGSVTFLIPYEYRRFESITIHHTSFASAVNGMQVLSNAIYQGDFVTARADGQLVNTDGTLNETAVNTIEDGRGHQWLSKLIITAIVLLILILVWVYRACSRRLGTFKAIFLLVMLCAGIVVIFVAVACQPLAVPIYLGGVTVSNVTLAATVACVMLALTAACVVCDTDGKAAKRLIITVYVLACTFALGKMLFYTEKVAGTPDEISHISYVASLEQSDSLFVPFEDKMLAARISNDNETLHAVFEEGTVNNLRHPPLYYWLCDAVDSVTFLEDGTFTVDLDRLRGVGIALTMAALVLMAYIGYTRLKRYPLVHLTFAAVAVSVPMLTYVAAGVNNDSLTFLTVTVTFLGLLRYHEHRRNTLTYTLIALGISTTLMTKMTAGILVTVAALTMLLVTLAREKNAKELLTRRFFITLPLYAAAGAYYLYVFACYGGFQPSLPSLNEAYAHTTGFYPAPEARTVMGIVPYISYFAAMFFFTWTGIAGHILVLKPGGSAVLEFLAPSCVLLFLLLLLSKTIRRGMRYVRPVGAMGIGMAVTLVMQMVNGYNIFMERGYGGGVQSRYYLCIMAALALCAAMLVQKALEKTDRPAGTARTLRGIAVVATAVFVLMLFYDDFPYFLLHFSDYLR